MDRAPSEEITTIRSVTDYVKYVETQCPETTGTEFVLFRGQHQEYEAGLVPSIARCKPREGLISVEQDCDSLLAVEQEILKQFQKKSLPFLEREPKTALDWLTVAQHHSVPTRLLDWSCNALASLWFVVDGDPAKGADGELADGVIYIFRTRASDFKEPSDMKGNDLFDYKKIFIYEPPSITRRVFAQYGYFTVHPFLRRKSCYVALDQDHDCKKRLSKLVICPSRFEHIRTALDRLGINRFSIYQSLDELGDHLKWYYVPPSQRR